MRKNGFTLIELLAVIVILAIIALIATPIILGIINDAREKANERSVELYASAVRNGIAAYQLREGKEVEAKTYTKDTLPFEVEYDGKVDCTSIVISEDGKVSLDKCTVNGGEKTYNYGTKQENDVIKLCTANTTKAIAYLYGGLDDPMLESSYGRGEVGLLASVDGAYTTGVAYTCNFIDDSETNNMTFFVLSSTENDVTLIAGSYLGGISAWCGDETLCKTNGSWDNTKGPITANAVLLDRTSTWGKLTEEQKSTIKLPTKDQIEGAYEGTMPKWLYSFTTPPFAISYWTSTPDVSYSSDAWVVDCNGNIYGLSVNYDSFYGVRPVITLSKNVIE